MSMHEGAKYLEAPMMGRGILLGGVTGVDPANVLVIGGGVVGSNAARMAAGLGARVTVLDSLLTSDPSFSSAVNMHEGHLTLEAVAEAHGMHDRLDTQAV